MAHPQLQGTPALTLPTGTFSQAEYNINLDTGSVIGEKLLICIGVKGQVSDDPITFDTLAAEKKYSLRNGTQVYFGAYMVPVTGAISATEGINIETPAAAGDPSVVVFRLRGWSGNLEAAGSFIGTTTPDPPNLIPSFGLKEYLWLAFSTANAGTRTFTGFPSGYVNTGSITTSHGAAQAMAWAFRELAATSEDPGNFTIDVSANSHAMTFALEPSRETMRPTATRNVSAAYNPNVDPPAAAALAEDPDQSTLLDPLTLADPTGSGGTHPAQDPNTPSLAVTGFTATTLTSEANVFDTSDATAATHAPATNNVDYGRYFQFPAADFTGLPANAVITGMTLRVRARATTNNRISLFMQAMTANGGTVIGAEGQADGGTPLGTTVADYGANTVPALNAVPTRAQLVSGTFGIRLRWRRSNSATLELYRVQVTVTYIIPGTTLNTKAEVLLGNPAGGLASGASSGEIRLAVNRKGTPDSGAGNPTVRAEIHENASGTVLATPIPDTAVTSSGTVTVLSGFFNNNVFTDKNNAEVWLIGTGVPGGAVEFDAVEWNAELTQVQAITKTITDTLGLSDSANTVKSVAKAVTDALGLSDSQDRARTLPKSVTDTLGINDSRTQERGKSFTVTDSIGITDSRTVTRTLTRAITDALGMTDSRTVTRTVQRAITDSLGVLDVATRAKTMPKSVTDALGITDTANKSMTRTRILTDSMGIVDVATPAITTVISKSVTDALGITDSRALVRTVQRAITDTLGIGDSRTVVRTVAKSITDNLGITDNRVLSKGVARVVNDTLGMTDSTLKSQAYVKSVSDSLGITDSASKQLLLIITRTITDNLGVTDSRVVIKNVVKNVNDTLGIQDSRVVTKAIAKGINDSIGISDTLTKTMTRNRIILDTLGVADSTLPVKTSFIQRTINDTLGITDVADDEKFRLIARTVTDSVGIVDSRTKDVHIVRTDTLGMSDAVSKISHLAWTITDELGLIDNQEYIKNIVRNLTDVITVTDDTGKAVGKFIDVTDTLGLADGVEWRVIGFTVAPFMTAELIAIPTAQAELLGSPNAIGQLLGIPSATGVIEP